MKRNLPPRKRTKKEIKNIARNIKLLILDVDGVLTDGSIILDNKGNEYKLFHVRDGHGIKMLMKARVEVAIITGRSSKVVERRAKELGIREVFQKCHDKVSAYQDLLRRYSLDGAEVAYIGDDIVDAPVMSRVGLPITVSDADREIKKYAMYVTKQRGGRGAVREVTDYLLKAKGLWQRIIDGYFEA
ncbi:MAG: 3-deoxy-manno-octulosonate-8-phosphatase KdsC [Acidobacteriota bacterium]